MAGVAGNTYVHSRCRGNVGSRERIQTIFRMDFARSHLVDSLALGPMKGVVSCDMPWRDAHSL